MYSKTLPTGQKAPPCIVAVEHVLKHNKRQWYTCKSFQPLMPIIYKDRTVRDAIQELITSGFLEQTECPCGKGKMFRRIK